MKEMSNQLEKAKSEILLFNTDDGKSHIQVRLEDNMVWLTQAQLAELFQTTSQNITLHIKAIYKDGELLEDATCKQYLQVRYEGKQCSQIETKRITFVAM